MTTQAFVGATLGLSGVSGTNDYLDTRVYDSHDRLRSITRTGNSAASLHVVFGYDLAGRRSRMDRYEAASATGTPNWDTDISFDNAGRVLLIQNFQGATTTAETQYLTNFTSAGLIRQTDVQSSQHSSPPQVQRVKTYSYDIRGQLRKEEALFSGVLEPTYQTDLAGNRILDEGSSTPFEIGTYNRLIEDNDWTFKYDAESNLQSKAAKDSKSLFEYQWDHRNRLVNVTLHSNSNGSVYLPNGEPDPTYLTLDVDYHYDANNRWIGREVNTSVTPVQGRTEYRDRA